MTSLSKKKSPIAVGYQGTALLPVAEKIATQLNLELSHSGSEYNTILMVHPTHIELIDTTSNAKPFLIDFNSGALTYRRQHGGGRSQAICRAIGLKNNKKPWVIDATAGLGRDSFILASLGCRITLFERNPVLQILLEDGLQRGRNSPATEKICQRMELIMEDIQHFTCTPPLADVMYLDPMYPHRRKSSLVKKEMRIIRQLVGADPDSDDLLKFALQTGIQRIVVKRPKNAPFLANKKPSAEIKEKNSRFDVYLR